MAEDLSQALERNIPLFEMVETLRREMAASMNAAARESLRFKVEEVELELRVQVRREHGAAGKLGFWVVSAGGETKQVREDVHVFKLKLKPETTGEREVLVSESVAARPAQPAGRGEPGAR